LRGILALVLAYALVLQSFVFAATSGGPLPGSADDTPWAAELCSHHGGATSPGEVPPQGPADHEHCLYCIAGAVYVAWVPLGAPQYRNAVFIDTIVPLKAQRLVAPRINASAWPRGPPTAAV
jgi:Protein of unknown function (DUF2946)